MAYSAEATGNKDVAINEVFSYADAQIKQNYPPEMARTAGEDVNDLRKIAERKVESFEPEDVSISISGYESYVGNGRYKSSFSLVVIGKRKTQNAEGPASDVAATDSSP